MIPRGYYLPGIMGKKKKFFSNSQQLSCHAKPSGASFTGIGLVLTVQGHSPKFRVFGLGLPHLECLLLQIAKQQADYKPFF
jgi:hypothetical protein